jgi:hypothetical protein
MTWCNPIPGYRLVASPGSEDFKDLPPWTTGIPVGSDHPGAFGFQRANHCHEGVDLYCQDNTYVHAVEGGLVVGVIDFTGGKAEPPSPWWHDTQAILVQGPSGVVVYGEIRNVMRWHTGDRIAANGVIGAVTPVLKKNKGRPMSMLHLELHTPGTKDAFEWLDVRPPSLLDPTPFLLEIAEKELTP